jgi:hypothetical protein
MLSPLQQKWSLHRKIHLQSLLPTALRDALVKEFEATLSGKAPPFPEEDMEQRKKAYLAFLLGEEV